MEANEPDVTPVVGPEGESSDGVPTIDLSQIGPEQQDIPKPNERVPTARRIVIDDSVIPVDIPLTMAIGDIRSALSPLFPHIARSEPTVEIVENDGVVVEEIRWSKKMGTNGIDQVVTAIRSLPAVTLRVDQEAVPGIINRLLSGTYTIGDGLAHLEQVTDVRDVIARNDETFRQRGNTKVSELCSLIPTLPSVSVREHMDW